jgi:hypothetical protein
MKLVPCTGCRRHVRCEEPVCPFCGVALSCASSKAGTAAAAFLAASLALTGCPDNTPKAPEPVALYGGPPTKNVAPVASQTPATPTPDQNPPVARYGAPPVPKQPDDQPK